MSKLKDASVVMRTAATELGRPLDHARPRATSAARALRGGGGPRHGRPRGGPRKCGAATLAAVQMPNRNGFIVDDRPDTKAVRCMSGCVPIAGGP